jgi:hypothetical protein
MKAIRLALTLAALLTAAPVLAASPAWAQHEYPEIGWTMLPPIKLNVARLEIVKQYQPSNVRPHVDTAVPRSLLDAADRWARDRLHPVGSDGYAVFMIGEASILETPLDYDKGITSTFKNPAAARYDGHLAVRLEVHGGHATGGGGVSDGAVTGEASATRTTARDANQDDIAQQQYLLVSDAMTELNRVLDGAIHQYLIQFIAP